MSGRDIVQCVTCGVERERAGLPEECPICADERQYLPAEGQRWTTPGDGEFPDARLEATSPEPGVQLLHQHDGPGIGQVPLLVTTDQGNVMLEVPALFTREAVELVRGLGGISAIMASHPHMYGLQSLWSEAFDHCPVYVSRADEQWLGTRPRNTVVWEGEQELPGGMVASQPGGHFPGSVVVHWPGRDGRGVLFTGDTMLPVAAPGWVAFMRSYPNLVPLSAAVVRRIAKHVSRHHFERLYGNFGGRVEQDAAAAVQRSAERHAAWASGEHDDLT